MESLLDEMNIIYIKTERIKKDNKELHDYTTKFP